MPKCSRCGLESDLEQAFQKNSHFFGLFRQYYCPTCRAARELNDMREILVIIAAALVLGPLFTLILPGQWYGQVITSVALMLMLFVPVVVFHELGHLLVARWMGLRAFAIVIGQGRTLLRRRALGTVWEVRGLPFSGVVMLGCPTRERFRLRRFLTVLAGPLTHVIWLAALVPLRLAGNEGWSLYARLCVDGLIIINATTLVSNLIPRRAQSAVGEIGSDGAQLLRILRMKASDIDALLAIHSVQEALDRLDQRDLPGAEEWVRRGLEQFPSDVNLINARGLLLMRRGESRRAHELFAGLLARADLHPVLRAVLQNNVAYSGALSGDAALLEEADRLSEQAVTAMPWSPELRSTRGAVLLLRGEIQPGLDLLRKALPRQHNQPAQAEQTCLIAIGEARLGNRERARQELELARRLDPDCPLLARAAAEIEAAA